MEIIQAYAKPFRVACANTVAPCAGDMVLVWLPRAYADGCLALCFRGHSGELVAQVSKLKKHDGLRGATMLGIRKWADGNVFRTVKL